MDGWYPRAIRDELGGGLTYAGGKAPWRGVLHSTEGKSYASARAAYVTNNSEPHFTVTAEGGVFRAFQHIALTSAARSLRNLQGGTETGRLQCVQAEIVGTCNPVNAVSWPAWLHTWALPEFYLDGIRDLMRWVEGQTGIQRHAPAFASYPGTYGTWPGRMDAKSWQEFNGWCGHQHVPENTHGDPGRIHMAYLLSLEDDDMTPEQDKLLRDIYNALHPDNLPRTVGKTVWDYIVDGYPMRAHLRASTIRDEQNQNELAALRAQVDELRAQVDELRAP